MQDARTQSIGDVLDNLTLPAVDSGVTGSLDAALAGRRGALVVFWSGVCTHCVRYDRYFNDFPARHPDVAFFGVATRLTESRNDVNKTAAERGLTFPLYFSGDGAAAAGYLAQQTPRVYLVDHARRLLYRGAIDNFKYADDPEYQPYLQRALTSFLAGEPIGRADTPSFGCAVSSPYYLIPRMIERKPRG
ncbi:MAG TPA: hypothetical protein VHZ73_03810 [Vicinamibacterales bacterium]|jgi:hypothetical protein|nr:hypothetical protein [Vicinamibacterales bacterium]